MPQPFQQSTTGLDLLEVPLSRPGNGSFAATRAPVNASELVAAYFSRCADTIGLPRSLAQLYATLFLSEEPLVFEEIVVRSGLSKASASTRLRDLEQLHGVERVMVSNDRLSFSNSTQLAPTFESFCRRIGGTRAQGRSSPARRRHGARRRRSSQ